MTDVEGHAHHDRRHAEITRRLRYVPYIPRSRRRHANGQAAWKIADHLRCCHGVRNVPHRVTITDLVAVHQLLHRARADA